MSKNNRKDIFNEGEVDYTFLSVQCNRLRVLIVGAGKAGIIKARGFISKKCYVEVVAKEFSEDFKFLESQGAILKKEPYKKSHIMDKHLIVIAIDDLNVKREIINDCESEFKIFINSTDFKEGMAVVPVEKKLKNLSLAINSKVGNPKGVVMVSKEIKKDLKYYDDFIGFSATVRKKAKAMPDYKKDIIDFITSKDYFFMWKINKSKVVMDMFYDKETVNYLLGGRKGEFNYSNEKE